MKKSLELWQTHTFTFSYEKGFYEVESPVHNTPNFLHMLSIILETYSLFWFVVKIPVSKANNGWGLHGLTPCHPKTVDHSSLLADKWMWLAVGWQALGLNSGYCARNIIIIIIIIIIINLLVIFCLICFCIHLLVYPFPFFLFFLV